VNLWNHVACRGTRAKSRPERDSALSSSNRMPGKSPGMDFFHIWDTICCQDTARKGRHRPSATGELSRADPETLERRPRLKRSRARATRA